MTNKNLETILNYLTDSLILCNRDFQINESNNSARMVFGMGEDIKGSHCYELLRNRTEPCEDCPLSETIECGSLVPVNYYDKRFDEYFEERTHPILKDDDSIDGFILVAKNVTKTRQIEDQSTQSKKLAAIGQISAGIAHDFNNVLTGVLGQVELMKMRYDDAQILKHVSMIERAVLDGKATVRRMQDFTRTKKEERKESVDLKPMLVDVVAFSKPRWQKSAEKEGLIIEPVLELSDDLTVIGNASDIQNALTNVVFNGIDAMPDGGLLSVKAKKSGKNIIVQIKDTGIGMTTETQEKMFDPFFSTKGVNGVGLGMSEVFGVMKRNNGSIEIDSEIGKGTTMTLTFPAGKIEKVSEKKAGPGMVRKSKILVVDDEDYVLEILKDLLERFGHTVSAHLSGSDAIEDFKKNHHDIIITDLGMPDITGQEVAEQVKMANPKVPVILLSGWAIDLEEDRELSRFVDLTLTKPFTVEEIQEVIQSAAQLISAN